MKKTKKIPKLGLHKLITFVYLPLSTAFCIYVAIGNVFDIGRLQLQGLPDYIEAVTLMLPFVTAILHFMAIIGLIGLTRFGLRIILFSSIFRTLLELFITYGVLTAKNTEEAVAYLISCIFNILVYIYYRRRECYFVKGGQSLKKAYEIIKKAEEIQKAVEEPQKSKEEETPAEKEETPSPAEGTVQEKEETLPPLQNEETEQAAQVEEAVPLQSEDVDGESFKSIKADFPLDGIVKRTRYIYEVEKKVGNVKLLQATLNIYDDKTIVEIEVENTSSETYSSSTWKFGECTFTSTTPIEAGITTIAAEAEKPLTRLEISLVDVK